MKTAVAIVCMLLGFFICRYLLAGPLAIYASILISYHLFLAYLVITAERETGMSLPWAQTVLTHGACLAFLIGTAMGRDYIPLFGLLRYLLPGLAPFEAEWLFSGGRRKPGMEMPRPHVPMPDCTASDYDDFLQYLCQERRAFRKPGRSVREEHVLWMADRVKKEAAAAAAQAAAVAAQRGSAHPAAQ